MPSLPSASTSLTITNPLVLYRSLLNTKRIKPDPAQHRLALHLQKLYFRLKDYEPQIDYVTRLRQINQAIARSEGALLKQENGRNQDADIRSRAGILSSFFARDERETLALTRVLTSHEAALELQSPRGLLLHGEVGTGKSMLIDLLADCLPNARKKRWHFNTFMLETFANLEQIRLEQCYHASTPERYSAHGVNEDYPLLVIARDMIVKSPILFLDEFQLPDRAASRIISNLLTCFFQLGGVVIATSNRMPEELAKASGVEYGYPPIRGGFLGGQLTRMWRASLGVNGFGRTEKRSVGNGEGSGFLEVLKARCEVWEMEGKKDWRRQDINNEKRLFQPGGRVLHSGDTNYADLSSTTVGNSEQGIQNFAHKDSVPSRSDGGAALPSHYFIFPQSQPDSGPNPDSYQDWELAVRNAAKSSSPGKELVLAIPWEPASMQIYGRSVTVPQAYKGTCLWAFAELCGSNLGPADYITLASTFHTLVLVDIPVLTFLKKNEARRLITLLDALYEARCKLLVRAEAGPDEIFFPETRENVANSQIQSKPIHDLASGLPADSIYPEVFSEMHQDLTMPFRPNTSPYTSDNLVASASEHHHRPLSRLADEDSDFGPLGPTNTDPHSVRDSMLNSPDFSRTASFTGEDEKFAYKRASSRLWEMCSSSWWARDGEGWWRPTPLNVRGWEHPRRQAQQAKSSSSFSSSVTQGSSVQYPSGAPDKSGLDRHAAALEARPPRFSWVHAWGMMKWGKKAGVWGQGVDGLKARQERKVRQVK